MFPQEERIRDGNVAFISLNSGTSEVMVTEPAADQAKVGKMTSHFSYSRVHCNAYRDRGPGLVIQF
jgi:hypothetical protein